MNEIAAERAREFGIAGQQAGESDYAFGHRVALELRSAGHIIEAHEAESGHLYDDLHGDAMTGIMGAVAQAVGGIRYDVRGTVTMSAISILEALIRRETEARNIQERLCETTPWDSQERLLATVRKQKHTAAIDVLTEALNAIEAEARQ